MNLSGGRAANTPDDSRRTRMIYAGCAGTAFTRRCALREACVTWMILLVGLVVGMVSGVVGIGGGVLFIPALVWLLGMSQLKAQGTSLGALLLPVGLFAFLEYYRKGNADLRVGLLLAAGFLVGGYFGAAGAQHIPEVWLRRIFAVTLVAIGGRMWFSR